MNKCNNIAKSRINVCNYIKNKQDVYSEMFNKLVYDLLFSEYILSLDELSVLSIVITTHPISLLSADIIEKEKLDMIHTICTTIQSEKDNSFVEFVATANNIYINTNECNCKKKATIGKLYMYCIEDTYVSHKDIIILTEKHVVKHIGIVINNTINWNDKISICGKIYMKFDVPDNDIINIVTSKIILLGLN